MPGAVSVPLRAGQAVFYNNNLIHCSHPPTPPRSGGRFTLPQRHSPADVALYLLDADRLTDDYLDRSTHDAPDDGRHSRAAQYPEMSATWQRFGAVDSRLLPGGLSQHHFGPTSRWAAVVGQRRPRSRRTKDRATHALGRIAVTASEAYSPSSLREAAEILVARQSHGAA
jgi:hypothetical protein